MKDHQRRKGKWSGVKNTNQRSSKERKMGRSSICLIFSVVPSYVVTYDPILGHMLPRVPKLIKESELRRDKIRGIELTGCHGGCPLFHWYLYLKDCLYN
ncbi:hypothetical protein IEQ34_022121 [Dendrobium chrysotoxum]|uniref:Uncharacterized protein n=1 Tax=Dendrobium chrysotoxum TaxID=161865 RepID=A0AAV7FW94_DENCH|nr:hypothetical protein IEQ34_022121 [Dendrobium chrysotoxum]